MCKCIYKTFTNHIDLVSCTIYSFFQCIGMWALLGIVFVSFLFSVLSEKRICCTSPQPCSDEPETISLRAETQQAQQA